MARSGLALLAVTLALACWAMGCRDAAPPRAPAAEVPEPAGEARRGTVRTPSGVEVSVVGVRRTSRDVVQVDLMAANAGTASLDLADEFGRAGGLGQAFLLSEDGRARVFVLADGQGAPQCSTPAGALAPGARQALFLRFAAQSPSAHRVTLVLPGLEPLAAVEVPPAHGAS